MLDLSIEPGPFPANNWWLHTDAFSRLEGTEKVGLSYALGMAVAKAMAARFLRMPWLLHVSIYAKRTGSLLYLRSRWRENFENYFITLGIIPRPKTCRLRLRAVKRRGPAARRAMLRNVFGAIYSKDSAANLSRLLDAACSMSSPDLFGPEYNADWERIGWSVIECKGRSGGAAGSSDFQESIAGQKLWTKAARNAGGAMLQALARTDVGAEPVTRHIASHVYFDRRPGCTRVPRPAMQFIWKDPDTPAGRKDPKREMKMIGSFMRDYYAPILNLLGNRLGIKQNRAEVVSSRSFDNYGFSIMLHPAVIEAFAMDNIEAWARLPNLLGRKLPEMDDSERDLFAGRDGVTVKAL